jgi:AraC-like DNA-binding protein
MKRLVYYQSRAKLSLAGASSSVSPNLISTHFSDSSAKSVTPFEYLTDRRIGVAQRMLRQGESLKLSLRLSAIEVQLLLTSAFTRKLGLSPTEWLSKSRSVAETA